MGLCIRAVSADYHYDEKIQDNVGEEYSDVDIGYIGFKLFRDSLVKYASNGRFNDSYKDKYDDGTHLCGNFYNDNDLRVCINEEDFTKEDLENGGEDLKIYFNKLNHMKKNYPKLYQVFPLFSHHDTEGEIPLEHCKMILPVIKEFYEHDKHNYGYSGWDYNFTEELINVLETAINHGGKLDFC